jgi:hypothetical protein
VRNDWQTVKVRYWRKSVLNGDVWKMMVERTKTHTEMYVASIKKKTSFATAVSRTPAVCHRIIVTVLYIEDF